MNIASLGAQRRLGESTDALTRSYERLSSGMRINRASDDAAGLAIATSLRADARIYSQGIRNIGDAVSVLGIAEGAVTSLSNMTIRMRELATQAASGTYSRTQRESLNSEAQALIKEFNRITASTTFNGRQLLDGSLKELFIQAGGSQIKVGAGVGSSRTVGNGSFNFLSSAIFSGSTGGGTFGDINGDGIEDIVRAVGTGSNDIQISLGNGDGTFAAETSISQFFTNRVALQDINNDGKLDIIGTGNGSGELMISLGNGDGTFAAFFTNAAYNIFAGGSNNLGSVGFADFNQDGILDVVVGNSNTSAVNDRVYVLYGNGNGSFARGVSIDVGDINGSSRFGIGDIDSDGKLDFVVNTGTNNNILFGNGDGTFRAVSTISMGFAGGNGSYLVDLNNDGKLDLISSVTAGAANISIQLGNGDGTFGAIKTHNGGSHNAPFEIGDVNGDGIIDFVSHHAGYFSTNLGNGDGTFAGPITRTITTGGTVRIVDLNGDGAVEVTVMGIAGNRMDVYAPVTQTTGSIKQFNILTQENARSVLNYLDSIQERLGREFSWLGSYQSRLRVAASNLGTARENYLAAESRITDVDVAEETSTLIRTQILQRAGASVLGQANIQPKLALMLLKQ